MTKNASEEAVESITPQADLNESRPAKKRKLRPPGEAFKTAPGPADNPTLHQGRSRAAPHIEGQWSTHIYIEPSATAALVKTLQSAIDTATDALKATHDVRLHSMITKEAGKGLALHLSLSRPIQLWTGQRASFISACRAALTDMSGFDLSFANFDVLTNDERTRGFLVCEIGYGHDQLESLTSVFNKVVEKNHLPKYYAEPRFHVSIAWWLHDDGKALSPATLKTINDILGSELRKPVLEVDSIKLKIGKDVTAIGLS